MNVYRVNFPSDEGLRYERIVYPAGEKQIRFNDIEWKSLAEAKIIIVEARIQNGDVMELALLKDAIEYCNAGNASHVILYLPYLPYSRADRRFTNGDCHGLKVFGKHIDNMGFSYVVTLDVHSDVARRYIANLLVVSPEPLINSALSGLPKDTLVLYPDAGALKRYNTKAKTELSCTKKRDPKTGVLSGFNVPSKELIKDFKHILIVDDICDGGGTFIGILDELRKEGINTPVSLYVTHGIFSKGLAPLSGFSRIYTTDSFKGITGAECSVFRSSFVMDSDVAEELGEKCVQYF